MDCNLATHGAEVDSCPRLSDIVSYIQLVERSMVLSLLMSVLIFIRTGIRFRKSQYYASAGITLKMYCV